MKLPRVRFTMRRSMILIAAIAAILAISTGLERRKARFQRLSSYHRGRASQPIVVT